MDDTFILDIFKYCQTVFAQHGINLQFPPDTDPKTTYKWRYLTKFCEKVKSLNFSENAIKAIIEAAAIQHKKMLKQKGLAILLDGNIIKLGMRRLDDAANTESFIIDSVTKSRKFLDEHRDDKPIKASVPNIVTWYTAGNIHIYYFSVSKYCLSSMRSLFSSVSNKRFHGMMPQRLELFDARQKIMNDKHLKQQARKILREDWSE